MKVLVAVLGTPRAGKDTLIRETVSVLEERYRVYGLHVSSITPIKDFLYPLLQKLGSYSDEPTGSMRQCLADIKKALDKHFQYTVRYAKGLIENSPDGGVIFYQLRELELLHGLIGLAHVDGFALRSVFVSRSHDFSHRDISADTESYAGVSLTQFDNVVINASLATLPRYANILAEDIVSDLNTPAK